MATFNEELFDAMLRHQIGLLRYAGSVRNKIWALLDATEADLKREIQARAARAGLDAPRRLQNLETMLANLRETRLGGWKEARATWFEEMRALAISEPKFFDQMIGSVVPVELGAKLPPNETLRAIVSSRPFEGKTLAQWADDVQRTDLKHIEDQVKIGLVQGEHPNAIARRIVGTARLKGRDGVTQITRRNAAAITRTVASGVASEAREQYLRENSDLAPKKVFTATLDSRTTPICRSLDGNIYDVDDPKAPVLPLHFNERSVYSPVVDGEVVGDRPARGFTERSLLREFAELERLDSVPRRRADLPRGTKSAFDEFSRRRMRELTGTVPAKTTYTEFLRRQPAAIQDDILGPTRGALFRRGGLELDKFVEVDGRELTLAELARRHSEAFRSAGLDPAVFK